MEIALILLVIASAIAGRVVRWWLGKSGVLPTIAETRALDGRARRLAWEADQFSTELDRATPGRAADPTTFMPALGDFLLAAEDEPALAKRKARKAVERLRAKLSTQAGFDSEAFTLMREKAVARAAKRARKTEKRGQTGPQRAAARRG